MLPNGCRRLVVVRHTRPLPFNQCRARPPRKGEKGSPGAWRVEHEIDSWRTWPASYPTVLVLNHVRFSRIVLEPPVVVTVDHFRINRSGMPDVGAPVVAVKALLDGLVDLKFLHGDNPDVVRRIIYEAPTVVGFDALRLTIDEQPAQQVLLLPAEGES